MNSNKDDLSYELQIRTGITEKGYRQILQFSKLSYERRKLIIDCAFPDDAALARLMASSPKLSFTF